MNKLVEQIDDHITRSLANGEYGQPIGLLRDCKAAITRLSTVRQDALEEAAAMADIAADDELEEEKRTGGQHTAESVARVIAKEIRSLIGKVTA